MMKSVYYEVAPTAGAASARAGASIAVVGLRCMNVLEVAEDRYSVAVGVIVVVVWVDRDHNPLSTVAINGAIAVASVLRAVAVAMLFVVAVVIR